MCKVTWFPKSSGPNGSISPCASRNSSARSSFVSAMAPSHSPQMQPLPMGAIPFGMMTPCGTPIAVSPGGQDQNIFHVPSPMYTQLTEFKNVLLGNHVTFQKPGTLTSWLYYFVHTGPRLPILATLDSQDRGLLNGSIMVRIGPV